MADETPQSTEPEQAEMNPATVHQPPASVVTVYDVDGRKHFASPTSPFVVDGLADGTLTEQPPAQSDDGAQVNPDGTSGPDGAGGAEQGDGGHQRSEEVPGGAEAGSAGDDPEPGTAGGGDGSGDGTSEAASTGRRRRTGTA